MESDSVFMHATDSVTNNGGQIANYDEDDAHKPTAFTKHEQEEEEDLAVDKHLIKEQNDVMAESMMNFASAQEALEREVQKFRDVEKADPLFVDCKAQIKQNDHHKDMKTELEEALKQRMKAEVEYLVISETLTQKMKADPLDQMKLMELASEQVEMMNKLEGAERKAIEIKRDSEKLEVTCEEILEREQVWKLQNRACRLSSCFMIQLMLLLLGVYLFVLQLSSSHNLEGVVVPT